MMSHALANIRLHWDAESQGIICLDVWIQGGDGHGTRTPGMCVCMMGPCIMMPLVCRINCNGLFV